MKKIIVTMEIIAEDTILKNSKFTKGLKDIKKTNIEKKFHNIFQQFLPKILDCFLYHFEEANSLNSIYKIENYETN